MPNHSSISSTGISPTGLVLLSIGSTQLGSAIAKTLFAEISPITIVLLRVGFAAIVLVAIWRLTGQRSNEVQLEIRIRSHSRALILFGVSLGFMNLLFYLAIERIPIGVAVALEFVGPLGVAVCNSGRLLDLLWVALAAIGILLLTPINGASIDPVGVGLALLAGACWAAYILLSVRVGRALSGGVGLALAMAVATMILLPINLFTVGLAALNLKILLLGFGVALLSSAIPYSLELEALRHLSMHTFGVLLSLEPAVAAIAGFVILRETLELQAVVAIALVTIAAAGSSLSTRP
ncbi:MAG: EamA family transporter [Myxacorys chilensis ATA2-1-KO14]|nr:EamA family transporter [Myxacorys chilensis ATA2-1-KO14]